MVVRFLVHFCLVSFCVVFSRDEMRYGRYLTRLRQENIYTVLLCLYCLHRSISKVVIKLKQRAWPNEGFFEEVHKQNLTAYVCVCVYVCVFVRDL